MRFTKSVSSSPPRKYNRTRALKRGPRFREATEADVRWFYAAYRKGDLAFLEAGLGPETFADRMLDLLDTAKASGTMIFVLEAGSTPVGFVEATPDEHRMEPHATWFSWATPRNKIESGLNFFNEMRRVWEMLVMSSPDEKKFFEAMCKYGVLRRVGTVERWSVDGRHATVFQTRKPEMK